MITHLISTTEFVKLMYDWTKGKTNLHIENAFIKTMKYANFISQKPELWMFISCDEEGNVLEEPKLEDWVCEIHGNYYYNIKLEEYNQAQSKVLFKGWQYELNEEWDQPAITNGTYSIIIGNTIGGYKTIEILASKVKLELTEIVLKQIGL